MAISNVIKVNLALLSAVVLWSISFAVIRIGLLGYSPGALALFRFGVASICLALFIPQYRGRLRLSLSVLLMLLAAAVLGVVGYSLLLNNGEKSVSSAMASFIVGQTPIVTSALAIGLLKEKPAFITICGIGISCFGVSLIVNGQSLEGQFSTGLLLVSLATVCSSLHSIIQKQLLSDISPFLFTAFSTWLATLVLLMFMPQLLKSLPQAPIESTLAALFLGIVPSALGQWLWSYGLSKTMVVRASAYLYTMPLFSTLFGWLLLEEMPHSHELLGGMIALFGCILVKKDITKTNIISIRKQAHQPSPIGNTGKDKP